MARTMLLDRVEGCVLMAHGNLPLDDLEFDESCERLNTMCAEIPATKPVGVLVCTETVGPSAKQRATMKYKARGRAINVPMAILTESAQLRGVVTAFKWLGWPMAAFRLTDSNAAFDFLKTPPIQFRDSVMEKILAMRRQLLAK